MYGKGLDLLLDAYEKYHEVCPDIRLVIAGDGPLMEETRDYVNRNKVNCKLLGRMSHEEIPALMRALDVFCFPSLWEGFATALVEAMAAGIPVVSTDHPATIEGVGDAAYTLNPFASIEDWLDAIELVQEDREVWIEAGLARIRHLRERQEREVGELIDFIQRFL